MENINIKEEEEKFERLKYIIGFVVLFFIIWGVVGFIAFIWSIMCFGKSGTSSDHIIGLLLAIFFGPFYFIYYGVRKSYCRRI